MRRIWTWLTREPEVAWFVLASLVLLLLLVGVIPTTIGGVRIVGGVGAVFVITLIRSCFALFTRSASRQRPEDTSDGQ